MDIPEAGLQMLHGDLERIRERLRDDRFAGELYRGLAGNRLSKGDHVVPISWQRAQEIVSGLRGEVDRPPVDLYQTGGETWLTDSVSEVLEDLGWRAEQPDPGNRDPVLADAFASPRPPAHR